MSDGTNWKWLVRPGAAQGHRVPDNPGVVSSFEERGFILTDLSGELDIDSPELAAAVADVQPKAADAQPKADESKDEAKSATKTSKKESE
jgi:hypothetical protein